MVYTKQSTKLMLKVLKEKLSHLSLTSIHSCCVNTCRGCIHYIHLNNIKAYNTHTDRYTYRTWMERLTTICYLLLFHFKFF